MLPLVLFPLAVLTSQACVSLPLPDAARETRGCQAVIFVLLVTQGGRPCDFVSAGPAPDLRARSIPALCKYKCSGCSLDEVVLADWQLDVVCGSAGLGTAALAAHGAVLTSVSCSPSQAILYHASFHRVSRIVVVLVKGSLTRRGVSGFQGPKV